MIVKLNKKNSKGKFTQVDNAFINDANLSWKAKGILLYCLSKPATWSVHSKVIMKSAKDREESIRSGFKELRKFGYAVLKTIRDKNQIKGREYTIYENPVLNKSFNKQNANHAIPETQKTATINNTDLINTDLSNINLLNNNLINNKETSNSQPPEIIKDDIESSSYPDESEDMELNDEELLCQTKICQRIEVSNEFNLLKNKYKKIDLDRALVVWEVNVLKYEANGNPIPTDKNTLIEWFIKYLNKNSNRFTKEADQY